MSQTEQMGNVRLAWTVFKMLFFAAIALLMAYHVGYQMGA